MDRDEFLKTSNNCIFVAAMRIFPLSMYSFISLYKELGIWQLNKHNSIVLTFLQNELRDCGNFSSVVWSLLQDRFFESYIYIAHGWE